MSGFKSWATVLSLLATTGIAFGQEGLQTGMRGRSIVVQYTEVVSGRRHSKTFVWTQVIYVSSRGRLFASVNMKGDSRRGAFHSDIMPDSNNSGGGTPFKWTESGLTRAWLDRRGNTLRQTIEIMRSNGGLTCAMSVTRFGVASRASHQVCKVVMGNSLGRT